MRKIKLLLSLHFFTKKEIRKENSDKNTLAIFPHKYSVAVSGKTLSSTHCKIR